MILLRQHIGGSLRERRLQQGRTLRQVSADAKVSLGYLSEVERGQKEASSELLAYVFKNQKTPDNIRLAWAKCTAVQVVDGGLMVILP